jgi:hypothetical protein
MKANAVIVRLEVPSRASEYLRQQLLGERAGIRELLFSRSGISKRPQ